VLTIVRYKKWLGFLGFLSMALFRIPLWLNRRVSFWKLLGCGKNGTFDIRPDLRQWGVLAVVKKSKIQMEETQDGFHQTVYGSFIPGWWKIFKCETWTLLLEPLEGHGKWDGKQIFDTLSKSDYEGLTGTLTRATIRVNKLKAFWKNVNGVATHMHTSAGFITSVGIGEVPWIKQATFSLWETKEDMKQFAYKMREHAEVIRKTRKENWYSEEMFIRFKPIASYGTLQGKNPLAGKL
jgi:heme-degrading monooxygenase HmoA